MYNLYKVFSNRLAVALYAYSMFPYLNTLTKAQIIFSSADINQDQGAFIYEDPYYGLGNVQTMDLWVEILIENVNNDIFTMPANLTGRLYTIYNYFGLSLEQTEALFSGQLLNIYILAVNGVYSAYSLEEYKCNTINDMDMCEPEYLGALQWSNSTITLNPPNLPPFGPSITDIATFIKGFPEINYFLQATTIHQKYPDVEFTVDNFYSLFNLNTTTGWPIYDPKSLMDVGRIAQFFELGQQGAFSSIAANLNLTSSNQAAVLWDYVNSLVDNTALQGRYDPQIYNNYNRGMASEYGMGITGSETVKEILDFFSNVMPLSVTSVYDYLRLSYELNLTCDIFIEDILPDASYICSIDEIA